MDFGIFFFSIALLLVGVWMIVRSNQARFDEPPSTILPPPPTSSPTSKVRPRVEPQPHTHRNAQSMMQQRSRVWWKVDELYAEFMEKTATLEPPPLGRTTNSLSTSRAKGREQTPKRDVTSAEVNAAFEDFLREKK